MLQRKQDMNMEYSAAWLQAINEFNSFGSALVNPKHRIDPATAKLMYGFKVGMAKPKIDGSCFWGGMVSWTLGDMNSFWDVVRWVCAKKHGISSSSTFMFTNSTLQARCYLNVSNCFTMFVEPFETIWHP